MITSVVITGLTFGVLVGHFVAQRRGESDGPAGLGVPGQRPAASHSCSVAVAKGMLQAQGDGPSAGKIITLGQKRSNPLVNEVAAAFDAELLVVVVLVAGVRERAEDGSCKSNTPHVAQLIVWMVR